MSLIRISESDDWIVDYDRERGMYRVSYFEDGHFKDECWFDCYEERECNLHSKWIGFPNNGVWDLKCDNCHRIIPFGQTPETMHYCPQCGARMDAQ
jgi:hypothetical protein